MTPISVSFILVAVAFVVFWFGWRPSARYAFAVVATTPFMSVLYAAFNGIYDEPYIFLEQGAFLALVSMSPSLFVPAVHDFGFTEEIEGVLFEDDDEEEDEDDDEEED